MGDCHYLDGNVKAEKMFKMATELVGLLGIDVKRLRLDWVSSAEGVRFAEIAREFTEQIKTLGPSQLKQAA
jgi:F420-non-reducing hydrogenase iron-sulfur subunit